MRIIYNTEQGVEIGEAAEPVIQLLMANGHPFFTRERIEIEIKRRTDDGLLETNIRPFYEAIAIGGFTREQAIELIAKKDLKPHHLSYRITDISNLPEDRIFRNAWHDENPNTETVDIDLEKAKEIKKNQFRELRKEKFKNWDVAYARADENGDEAKKQEIKQIKQQLRDITIIDFPEDIEQLKNFMPEILK